MYTFLKKNPHTILLVVGLGCLIVAGIFSFAGNSTMSMYFQYVYYVLIIPFIIISTKVAKKRRKKADESTFNFLKSYKKIGKASIRYFVPDESDHTIVNMWRNFRGLHTIRMFKGQYSDDNDVRSYRTYLLTNKQLFEAKLRGYYDTEDEAIVEKALLDSWMDENTTMKR